MKNKVLSLLSAAVLVLALGSMAKADTLCTTASTTSCSIDLTVPNGPTGQPDGTVYGVVTLTLVGSSINVDVATENGWTLHNADFGFNGTNGGTLSDVFNSYTFAGNDPGTPTFKASGYGNMDGFGTFVAGFTGGSGSSSGYTDLNFTVSSTDAFTMVGQLLAGNNVSADNWFVGQLSLGPNCTGFVGNTGSTGSTTGFGATAGADCSGTSVPEPGSLALFGTGILGMAGYLRRKLLS